MINKCITEFEELHDEKKIFFSSSGETLPLSSGNKITIRFTTMGPQTAKGFHFVYQGTFFHQISLHSTGNLFKRRTRCNGIICWHWAYRPPKKHYILEAGRFITANWKAHSPVFYDCGKAEQRGGQTSGLTDDLRGYSCCFTIPFFFSLPSCP